MAWAIANVVDRNQDLATRCKFDGISDEIREHLPDPGGIAHKHSRNFGTDAGNHLQTVFLRLGKKQSDHIGYKSLGVEGNQLKTYLPGLDLRQIENVVKQDQQFFRRFAYRKGVL